MVILLTMLFHCTLSRASEAFRPNKKRNSRYYIMFQVLILNSPEISIPSWCLPYIRYSPDITDILCVSYKRRYIPIISLVTMKNQTKSHVYLCVMPSIKMSESKDSFALDSPALEEKGKPGDNLTGW